MTRRLLVRRLLAAAAVLAGTRVSEAAGAPSAVRQLTVRNAARSFVGDRKRFATISPRSGAGRAQAVLDLVAERPLEATFEVVNRNGVGARLISRETVSLVAGRNTIPWAPGPSLKPGSYILRLRQLDTTPATALGTAVVRIIDVEATFRQRSALPGETVTLTRPDRCSVAAPHDAPLRPRGRADQQQLRDARNPGWAAAAHRPCR